MFDDVIKFAPCEHDLEKKAEYWQSDTFEKRNHAVLESIKRVTGYYPTKNRQPIRVGVFQVADKTTIDELVGLSKKLKDWFKLDCFQASIDRETNTAHMLFDFNEYDTGRSVHLNQSQQIVIGVTILRYLDLPRPKGAELWRRYFLAGQYADDPESFKKVLQKLKYKGFCKQDYTLLCDSVLHSMYMCQGLVK